MSIQLTPSTKKILIAYQNNEITEHNIYKRLSLLEKTDGNKQILYQLAVEEKAHYDFWQQYTGEDGHSNWFKIHWYVWMARILGLTFAMKLMEQGEDEAQKSYSIVSEAIPKVKKIIAEEAEHEQKLLAMINEERLNYIGSIVLGLNDALVELTGSLAGFTFAMQKTKLIAAAGLITGIAAMFSMAAAEYLSQKAEGATHPVKSAVYTGAAYLGTIIVLIMPYFFVANYIMCLIYTLILAIAVIFAFNFYLAVATDVPFKKRFIEMALISLGVATITFIIGYAVKVIFGLQIS
jgi:VIT1/CCC1 family predicted Fe2+/Mn2+ transporter